jgi:hypothetical protein
LASEASDETRLSYSALASEASGVGGHMVMEDTLRLRLPPVEHPADLHNTTGEWCEDCKYWMRDSETYRKHLVGKKHERVLIKAAKQMIPPPFPT